MIDYELEAIQSKDFYKKHNTRTLARLLSPVVSRASDLSLPMASLIHYIPEDPSELGVDYSHCLLHNAGEKILSHHVETLKVVVGRPVPLKVSTTTYLKAYRKRYRKMSIVKNFSKSLLNDPCPMV